MTNIVVLTGAGVSASAGIPTFRGEGGVWSDENFLKMSQAHHYGNYLEILKPRWLEMHELAESKDPTLFHEAVGEKKWTVVTQNVDGLHQRAGTEDALEVHGTLSTWRCLTCKEEFEPVLNCPHCSSKKVRPDMVLFGERLKSRSTAEKLIQRADLLVVAGTSGNVFPVAAWPFVAKKSILVNIEPWDEDSHSVFDTHFKMTSDEWVAEGMPVDQ